jgi:hypothetical protein
LRSRRGLIILAGALVFALSGVFAMVYGRRDSSAPTNQPTAQPARPETTDASATLATSTQRDAAVEVAVVPVDAAPETTKKPAPVTKSAKRTTPTPSQAEIERERLYRAKLSSKLDDDMLDPFSDKPTPHKPAAGSTTTGRARVTTKPSSAKLWIDFKPVGKTPWSGTLAPGTHGAEVLFPGNKWMRKQFVVGAGSGVSSVTFDLAQWCETCQEMPD